MGEEKTSTTDDRYPEPRHEPAERPGPAGGKRDRNRRAKVAAISTAALELFLTEGIEVVTIDRIAQAAGVAKGSFYRYFGDKTDLVDALFSVLAPTVREAFERCAAALEAASGPADLAPAYEALAVSLAEAFLEHPGLVRLYLQESRAPAVGARAPVRALADEIAARAIQLTEAAHAHGLLRPIDPRVTSLTVVGAVERLLFDVLVAQQALDPVTVAEGLITLVLDGIRAPAHSPAE
jgi:AcrR family transcriptional regulator